MEKSMKVCVTGGAGYLASFLINQLLQRGYTVHATLRNLGDGSKVGLLKGLTHAETRLKLFEADIYNPHEFAPAIEGCEVVLHMATPMQHYANHSQFKNTSEAAVAGAKMIMEGCLKSNTVKKLIYTASVVAASPLKEDGSGYKDSMGEECWTPLNLPYEMMMDYVHSKTLAEQEVLSYNGKGIHVVSLACGVVGGDTIQSSMADTMAALVSQALENNQHREILYKFMKFLEYLLGKVPIAHIHDVVEAHIFSMENPDLNGRFLCANGFLKSAEIASLVQKFRDTGIPQGFVEDTKGETKWGSRKLEDWGFQYKFDNEKIIEDSLLCAKRLGSII